jgi:hypothetical protein
MRRGAPSCARDSSCHRPPAPAAPRPRPRAARIACPRLAPCIAPPRDRRRAARELGWGRVARRPPRAARSRSIRRAALARSRHPCSPTQEDKPALQSRIAALTASRDILKREKKRLQGDYTALRAKLQRAAGELGAATPRFPSADTADLQAKLVDLNGRQLAINEAASAARSHLAAARPEERQIFETQLVVLQARAPPRGVVVVVELLRAH